MPVQSPERNVSSDNLAEQADRTMSRRDAVLRSAAAMIGLAGAASLLSGCSTSGASNRAAASTPTSVPPSGSTRSTEELLQRWGNGASRRSADARGSDWQPLPQTADLPSGSNFSGLIRRTSWSKGDPVPQLMDRMLPINKITVHHDGMSPFTSTAQRDAASRIEAIRRAHRSQDWGDIGYHYLIDPSGRVWEGRPLVWQGAHVKDNNEGNIGICMLGNYESQNLTDRQAKSLDTFLASTMAQYRIARNRVYTHREFRATACPGRSLQARMDTLRTSRSSAIASL